MKRMRPQLHLSNAVLAGLLVLGLPAHAQVGGQAGAFSRMGFGARGMGLANALTAVTRGDIAGYYNPASLPHAEYRNVSASFGILTLDRRLNFIGFAQAIEPNAGIAAGIINSGVSAIDGRDSDGQPTGPLRTDENQAFLGFGIRFKPGFSLGINIKFYHYRLYSGITSSSVGLDFGAVLPVSPVLTFGATVRDVNSTYRWDTAPLYGQRGNTTEDKFPLLYTFGAVYTLPDSIARISADIEASNQSTLIARAGVEVPLVPELTLRGGLDRIDLKEKGMGVRPALGFTVRREVAALHPALSYAFVIEPFATSGLHMISLTLVF